MNLQFDKMKGRVDFKEYSSLGERKFTLAKLMDQTLFQGEKIATQ